MTNYMRIAHTLNRQKKHSPQSMNEQKIALKKGFLETIETTCERDRDRLKEITKK